MNDKNKPKCSYCGSENVYGISRVVGYFSRIDNWNNSKKQELKRRQKGNYWKKEKIDNTTNDNIEESYILKRFSIPIFNKLIR